jgi:NADH-ubiquinone oxidoreductase chain 2
MLLISITFIIFYIALYLRNDITIILSRINIILCFLIVYLIVVNFYNTISNKGISIFNNIFQFNVNTSIFNIFIFIIVAIIISLNSFYPRKILNSNNNNNEYKSIINKDILLGKNGYEFKLKEYTLIILFIISGAIFLISSNDLLSIFLSIELQSYGLYILSTIYRNSELSTKAGLTYFLLGALSSCIILLGQSILYINSGNINIENIYILSHITSSIDSIYYIDLDLKYITNIDNYNYINYSLIILSVGFMFKVSAAPFHFWSPDVYDSIPTIVTTFVAIIAKISIFVLFLNLINYTYSISTDKLYWTDNLLISCFLSLLIGSILGLVQFRIKRLYAYSTINHIGFILLALCINSIESIQAFIFYIIQYSISNLNAFLILLAIGYFILTYYDSNVLNKELKEKNNSPLQLIAQLKGFYKINNMLSLSLSITLLSFLGIPPLLGFFGKQMVLSSALSKGYIFITLTAVITSVISAVYYLIIIKHIFFDKSEYIYINNNEKTINIFKNIKLGSHLTLSISILTLILIVYMFTSKIWLDLLTLVCLFIFNL